MDIVFLQDTQLRARSAACRYDAVIRYDVNLLNNGSYSQKEHRVLNCLASISCVAYHFMWSADTQSVYRYAMFSFLYAGNASYIHNLQKPHPSTPIPKVHPLDPQKRSSTISTLVAVHSDG